MNTDQIAGLYLKYFYQDSDAKWKLADNVPSRFALFVKTLPKTADLGMLQAALVALSSHRTIQAPSMPELLSWVVGEPAAARRVDEVLQNPKIKSATLGILLSKAWVTEAHSIIDRLANFFLL